MASETLVTRAPNLCPFTLVHSTLDKLCANVRIILKWYAKMWVGGFRLEWTLLVQDGCERLTLVTLVRQELEASKELYSV